MNLFVPQKTWMSLFMWLYLYVIVARKRARITFLDFQGAGMNWLLVS